MSNRSREDGNTGLDAPLTSAADNWGLPGMRERAERIGAKLTLWSRFNAGTEVELLVPHE